MGSPFINDPKRHFILEHIIEFPENIKVPSILPDKQTTDVLLESYFINVRALLLAGAVESWADEARPVGLSKSLTGRLSLMR
jgi:hypothetical protein